MIRLPHALLLGALCLFTSGCALTSGAAAQDAPRSPRQLARAIDAVLADDAFDNAFWAVKVVDLNSGATLYARHAEKNFVPASNTKLYTTAAGLDLLGPDYRYRTRLYVDGTVEDGVLDGNLIIRGSGDPVIGGRFTEGDRTQIFRQWADSLRHAGITRITGDIIGDDDAFDDQPLGYGWNWDDETYWYSAELSALSFNDNTVDVFLTGERFGAPASVRWEPHNTDYVTVVNASRTIHPDSSIDEGYVRERGTNRLHLSSLVPEGRVDEEALTVTNPTAYFVHVLRETLLREGIPVHGRPVDVDELSIKPDYTDGSLRLVATHASVPLAQIVEVINKRSQNLYADQLLKTLAAERPREPTEDMEAGSAEMGVEIAMETFARAGVDTSRIQLVDGSGLSRQNLTNANATTALLRYLWTHPDDSTRATFYDSLPIGGVDGTLQYRYRSNNDPARGNVRAKTGTVSNASTLSGYVTSAQGTPLAFSIMCNHYTVPTRDVRAAQDTIVALLARYRR